MRFSKFPVLPKIIKLTIRNITRSVAIKPYIANSPPKPLIVTLTGSHSRTGHHIGLILKQYPVIDELRLFDFNERIRKVVADLNLIDGSTVVKAYSGVNELKPAIENAHIIVVCPEEKKTITRKEELLFDVYVEDVRNIALFTSEFNPKAIFCIATQPVNSLVPMVSEEYKKSRNYDYRKIIGVTTVDVLRANTEVARCLNIDPNIIFCPVIGGSSSKSTVALLSYVKQLSKLRCYNKALFHELQSHIADIEPSIMMAKNDDNDRTPQTSRAYAIAQFVMQVCRGLKGACNCVECAFVKQVGRPSEYLSYMSTVIKLGPRGVEKVYMPRLSLWEGERLSVVVSNIRNDIERGISYVHGYQFPKTEKSSEYSCDILIAEPVTNMSTLDVELTPRSRPMPDKPKRNPRYFYS
ncbi:probable malate dehydrogenase, mitochondrial [Agrilus planipennis]|uniref:Malate dehydrogenase, mitochondrial n=1 Tax=Agrilus planipennis TaxID=224129 RepID=A0A1W4WS09_AGRPL|nr:probable malate dehydrogenase, mitochondrial [Agrilus planipennis]